MKTSEFYEQLEDQKINYTQLARIMDQTPETLYNKVRNRTLTMEEALGVVRESHSPTLLLWVLRQLRPNFPEKPH